MLTVACVRWGEKFGVEYVERLYDMVRRNLPEGFPGRFVCLTDRPDELRHLRGVATQPLPAGLQGWWNKLALFKPGTFAVGEKVLYFDLDTVITGPLEALAKLDAHFALLRDAYRTSAYAGPGAGWQSSVMLFRAGTKLTDSLWEEFECRRTQCGVLWPYGDQEYIEQFYAMLLPARMKAAGTPGKPWPPEILQEHLPGVLRSYKVDCVGDIPKGTSVVFFHGHPRPHEVSGGWVPEIWRVGGGSVLELVSVPTVDPDVMLANVRSNLAEGFEELAMVPATPDALAVIVGGGPSLDDNLGLLATLVKGGAYLFALNGAARHLQSKGIAPHFQVIVDARPSCHRFHTPGPIKLYASQVDPVLPAGARMDGDRVVLWHSGLEGIDALVPGRPVISGGHSVGIRALVLAYAMGFRRFYLFGYDSSLKDGAHHAYPQRENDADRIIDLIYRGKRYKAAGWMAQQVEDFKTTAAALLHYGCELFVVGTGLLPDSVQDIAPSAVAQRCMAIEARLEPGAVGVEVGVFAGELSKRLLSGPKVAKLHLVDSWSGAHPAAYAETQDFHASLTQEAQDHFFEVTRTAVEPFGDRALIWRMSSVEAAARFADESLDFVFLDADHSYDAVVADIAAWLPKVRPGGWLGGHDYENTGYPRFGVKRAVDERFNKELELGANFTWFHQIPLPQAGVSNG